MLSVLSSLHRIVEENYELCARIKWGGTRHKFQHDAFELAAEEKWEKSIQTPHDRRQHTYFYEIVHNEHVEIGFINGIRLNGCNGIDRTEVRNQLQLNAETENLLLKYVEWIA